MSAEARSRSTSSVAAPGAYACASSALLPVPQVRETHDLYLFPPEGYADVVAPPYTGMAAGDVATFSLVAPGHPPLQAVVTITADQVGRVIQWKLVGNDLWNMFGAQVDTFYQVKHASGAESESAVQVITIDMATAPLLPPATLDGSEDGLDPELFPEGVVVRVPVYPGAAVGDDLVLHWKGSTPEGNTVEWRRLDSAAIGSGWVDVTVAPEWLMENAGLSASVSYQYARPGAAQSSDVLKVKVLVPVVLAPPLVESAEAEGDGSEYKGLLKAVDAQEGAYVRVPVSEVVDDADVIELHWEGHPHGGRHVARESVSPLRYIIPAAVVAANIGGESKRFPVFYQVTRPNGRQHTSRRFQLRVRRVDEGSYPAPQCRQSQGKPGLSLADVPPEGVELFIERRWPFAAPGQLLTIWITGVAASGTGTEHIVRNALPVTPAEFDSMLVAGRLPRAVLQGLRANTSFTLRATVSHDGGDTALSFSTSTVTWLG